MKFKDVNWSYFGFILLLIFSALAILFVLTFIHELIHASIYEQYGCGHNIYFTWEGGRTSSMCPLTLGMDKLTELESKQSMVDKISYPLFYVLTIITGIITFIIFKKKDWL